MPEPGLSARWLGEAGLVGSSCDATGGRTKTPKMVL